MSKKSIVGIVTVRQLQIFLNKNPSTQVSFSGAGSPGNEGTYFGKLTASAVMKFQAQNNLPVTGFVGPLTRQKLNNLISSLNVAPVSANNANPTSTTSTSATRLSGPLPLEKQQLPRLYVARPQQIKKSTTFTLVGSGFLPSNTLHIGNFIFSNVIPEDSDNISFTIPATSTISNGTYPVWIQNSYGTSQNQSLPINLVITDSPIAAPIISTTTPAEVSGSQSVTVTGTGFDTSGNSIVSGFGTISNVSSNGTQLSFSPLSLIRADVLSRIPAGTILRIDFYVMSSKGVSNVFGTVNLKI